MAEIATTLMSNALGEQKQVGKLWKKGFEAQNLDNAVLKN